MKCPKCQAEILDDSQFCSKCGTPIHPGDKIFLSHTHTILRPIDELVPGTELAGKYKIIEVVGKGGMGIVYKAEDTKLKRNVALKFLPPELTLDKEAKDRFVLEAQAAAALSHPNICTIHEIDEEKGKSFIAMEYVEGKSLKNKIDKGPIAIEEAVDITIQVAEGMEQAHKKGIIHRDIKSANIMVTDTGQAKIMDFGLAKVKGGTLLTREGTTLGTVAYMSPEQARGEEVDHRTDIWSLGIVLYEMLSGQLPFIGDREASILYSVVHEEAKPVTAWNPDIPSELRQIIDRAMKKKPEARYTSTADVLEDLQKYKDSLKAEELGAFSFRSFLRRIRKPIVAIPALLIIAAIIIASIWYFDRQSKIRWAREVILPEIMQLAQIRTPGLTHGTKAYRMAKNAEKYIPNDPKLINFLSTYIVSMDIKTEPQGAHIYMKALSDSNQDWQNIGLSPITGLRVPVGYLQFRMKKEGYEPVMAVTSTFAIDLRNKNKIFIANPIFRALDKKGDIPDGMVRVAGADTDFGRIADFFIDKYEVTNRLYREFVEAGGYKEKKYWKHEFIKDGQTLSWEDARGAFVDQTGRQGPATWRAGDFPSGQENYPVSGVSWYEAAAYAEFAGNSLPTGLHWGIGNGEYTLLLHPWGTYRSYISQKGNFKGEGTAPVGTHDDATAFGALDMGGNVREWCWNETEGGRIIRGGAWNDAAYLFSNWSQIPAFDRSPKNGFRCVKYIDAEKIPTQAFEPRIRRTIDFYKEGPVPESIFQIYKDQFSYDKTALNIRVEIRDDSAEEWILEKISFDAAYGNERMAAFLFVPKNIQPPYQTVIYFPGQGSAETNSSQNLADYREFKNHLEFLVTNGRAVLYPIYKGTFERIEKTSFTIDSYQYVERRIQQVKDFKRSIDYLETRPDIDIKNLAYTGYSWGTRMAPIILAVEDRLKTAVLVIGGLETGRKPEINNSSYIRNVTLPVLMLNGRYDMSFPYETSSKPMFDLLGTPEEDKVQKIYETDHFVPLNEHIKETLAWLDRYLGPAKK
ncbi:MAG: protein kinase [Candidatus Aminicenantes bacterium]|nr:MAG: protein kinase [Candidatus Aminicenantes bacterium]